VESFVKTRSNTQCSRAPDQIVEIRYGRMIPNARPFLEIADRGPGVFPENAERIFEPFFSGGRGRDSVCSWRASSLRQTGPLALRGAGRAAAASFRLVFADPRRWRLEIMNEAAAGSRNTFGQTRRTDRGRRADLLELVSLTLSRMSLQTRTASDVNTARRLLKTETL